VVEEEGEDMIRVCYMSFVSEMSVWSVTVVVQVAVEQCSSRQSSTTVRVPVGGGEVSSESVDERSDWGFVRDPTEDAKGTALCSF